MKTGTLISLALYFILMIGIGLYAWRKSTDSSEGYLLGGRQLHPAVAARVESEVARVLHQRVRQGDEEVKLAQGRH